MDITSIVDTVVGVLLAAILAMLSFLIRSLISTLVKHSNDILTLSGVVGRLQTDSDDAEILATKYHDELIDLKKASWELDGAQTRLSARLEEVSKRIDQLDRREK